MAACEEELPTRVPGPRPLPVAVDAYGPYFVSGRPWSFLIALRAELEKRNMRDAPPREAAVVAQVDVGPVGYATALDLYLVREGHQTCAGRVLVAEMGMTTLDAAAGRVAELLARAITTPPSTPPDVPCGE